MSGYYGSMLDARRDADPIEEANMNEHDRRIMRLQVTPEALVSMCTNPRPFTMRITSGCLPEDAKSIGITHDFASNSFFIFVESAAFEEVPDGSVPPLLDVVQFERIAG